MSRIRIREIEDQKNRGVGVRDLGQEWETWGRSEERLR
jgi:hypothetical protein